MNILYRPQALSKKFLIKERLKGGGRINYNFRDRIRWYPAGWKFNKKVLGNVHCKLHYLACHAPIPIQKRWARAYKVFCNQHFGTSGRATVRYLNTYSCHSWM